MVACCYCLCSSASNSFQLRVFPELDVFLAVNFKECLLCAFGQFSLVTPVCPGQPWAVSSKGLLTSAQTFFLYLDFVCCLLYLCTERQWITNAMVINALSRFSGCSWLDWCILSWLSFPSCIVLAYPVLCTYVHYPCWSFLVWPYPFRKETRAAQVLKTWVNHRFTQRHGVCFWFISIPS